MSSEGSISNGSRIRQFGLYRSIDSRTEEFLRLSRKRQIRQGCACAAVSTAITVTLVVVVFFVYEYSLKSEMSVEDSLRTNWFSLINDTTDEGFQTKYSKSQIDRTTLTLLPILLKALQKNEFLKQIFEDQSSLSPAYDMEDTTEYTFGKKSLTKNWYRNPSSKLYEIAFKTTPSVFRNPKNLEYFRKVTKIRDYQRILAYVDKMISERVYIGSTRPTIKEFILEKSKAKAKPQIAPVKFKNKVLARKEKKCESKSKPDKGACNCPEKNGSLLDKILIGFEKLLSLITNSNKTNTTECAEKYVNVNKKETDINLTTMSEIITNHQQNVKLDTDKATVILEPQKITQSYKYLLPFESTTVKFNDYVDAKNTVQRFFFKPVSDKKYYQNKLSQQPTSQPTPYVMQRIVSSKHKQPVKAIDENDYDESFYKTNTDDYYINNRFDVISSQRHKMIYTNPYSRIKITTPEPSFSESKVEDRQKNLVSNKNSSNESILENNTHINQKAIETTSDIPNWLKQYAHVEQGLKIEPNTSIPLPSKDVENTKMPQLLFSTYRLVLEKDKQMRQKPKIFHGVDITKNSKPIIAAYEKLDKVSTKKPSHTFNVQRVVKPTMKYNGSLEEDIRIKLTPFITYTDKSSHKIMSKKMFADESMRTEDIREELTPIIATAYEHLNEEDIQIKLKPLTVFTDVPLTKENTQAERKLISGTAYEHFHTKYKEEKPKSIITITDKFHKKIIPTTNEPLLKDGIQLKLNTLMSTKEPLRQGNEKNKLEPIIATRLKLLSEKDIRTNLKPHRFVINELMPDEDFFIQEEQMPITVVTDEFISGEKENMHLKLTKDTTTKPVRSTRLPTVQKTELINKNYIKQSVDDFREEDTYQIMNSTESKQTNIMYAGNPEVEWKELESEHISALEALIIPYSQINNESDSNQKDQLQDYDFNNLLNYFDVND